MNYSSISAEFLQGITLKEISRKNNIDERILKTVLVKELGRERYLKISRSNGGKAVAKKLKDPNYRNRYVCKMRRNVKKSLSKLMGDPVFRDSWLKKSRKGSKKGISRIYECLENKGFYQNWVDKCRIGGNKTYKNKLGFHSFPAGIRRKWSLVGLKNTGRKKIGPNGEKMYNDLEVVVASILDNLGLKYEYERIVPVKNTNGFVSVDFTIKGYPDLIIEVTCWSKPEQKIRELKGKLVLLKKIYPRVKMVVVTSTKYIEEYEKLLESNINVFTPIRFKEYLISKLAG